MNEKQKKSRQNNNVIKDVSDFPEISQSDDIPIYGHNEQEDKRPNTANQRQKRVLDNEQFQQSLPSTKNQSIIISHLQPLKTINNKVRLKAQYLKLVKKPILSIRCHLYPY